MARRFVPVAVKVNVLILVSLTIGIGSVTAFLGFSLSRTIDTATRTALNEEADIVYEAIEQLMMPGEAPLVVNYFDALADTGLNIFLYRTDGLPAFSDNATIMEVNARVGGMMFAPGPDADRVMMAPEIADAAAFARVTQPPAAAEAFQTTTDGVTTITFLRPLLNLPKCTVCHGSDHTIRGVIDIRSDITASVRRQQIAIASSGGSFLLVLIVVGALMSRFIGRRFIAPLQEIGATCEAVTAGNFDRRSAVTQRDELGTLSTTVNTMVEGLRERFHLARFVSSGTLESISGGEPSRTEELTFFFSDVRGFTAYTERNSADRVVSLLNDLLSLQSDVIERHGGDVDKYVGDEVMAVFTGDDGAVRAARCAIEIHAAIIAERDTRFDGMAVGIGIHAGAAIVGAIGGERRADFTAIGDSVNTAARLCAGAPRDETLVGDGAAATLRTAGAELDGPYRMQAKGKSEALRVFKLISIPALPNGEQP